MDQFVSWLAIVLLFVAIVMIDGELKSASQERARVHADIYKLIQECKK